jgi:hypothetical protein
MLDTKPLVINDMLVESVIGYVDDESTSIDVRPGIDDLGIPTI